MLPAARVLGGDASGQLSPWLEWGLLTACFALPAWLSWDRWTDPLVDFGRQPYVAWRILEGERLYLDIAHVFGPLAAYVHAGVMGLLGVSIASIAYFNLFLVACFTLHLRAFFGWLAGGAAGLGAALAFLLLCAFPQYIFQANYNFVTPYSSDLVYGLMLSMLCLAQLLQLTPDGGHPSRWARAGVLSALVALGKPEACAALLTAVALVVILQRPCTREIIRFAAAAIATLLAVFMALLPEHGARAAILAVLGSFVPIRGMSSAGADFYLWVSGFDAPWWHIRIAIGEIFGVLLLSAAGVGLASTARTHRRTALVLGTILVIFLPAALLPLQKTVVQDGLRFLPLVLVALVWVSSRAPLDTKQIPRAHAWLVLAVFALVALLKILLAARLFHYGFALAMPAVVVLVARLLADGAVGDADRWWRRLPLLALMGAIALAHLDSARQHYALRDLGLQAAGDRLRIFDAQRDPRGPLVQEFIDWQRETIPPDATMLVLPDAAMLNFLSRHAAGTPYYALPSPELALHGEGTVLASLVAAPPDFVVLVDQSSPLLGHFGTPGYGAEILGWVGAHYTPMVLFGSAPLAGKGFGIGVLQRNPDLGAVDTLKR